MDTKGFAWDLYGHLKSVEGNLFFSPLSVQLALSRALSGARGRTEKQMREVLHIGQDDLRAVSQQVRQLEDSLRAASGVDGSTLAIANKLWVQSGYAFLPEFLNLCGADLAQVDFIRESERITSEINRWIEENTNHKIRNMLSPGALDKMVRLVIANAVYFFYHWRGKFKKEWTKQGGFHVRPGQTVTAWMMNQTSQFPYYEGTGVQVLQMPYVGDRLSMIIVLPKDVDGLAYVEDRIGAMESWIGDLRPRKVDVFFPRFKMEWGAVELRGVLMAMGMPDAFNIVSANFTGMEPNSELYISQVKHKAFVDVNEEGTEAAAATVVVMRSKSVSLEEPVVFRADHPFVFVIWDEMTRTPIFTGRVVNPI